MSYLGQVPSDHRDQMININIKVTHGNSDLYGSFVYILQSIKSSNPKNTLPTIWKYKKWLLEDNSFSIDSALDISITKQEMTVDKILLPDKAPILVHLGETVTFDNSIKINKCGPDDALSIDNLTFIKQTVVLAVNSDVCGGFELDGNNLLQLSLGSEVALFFSYEYFTPGEVIGHSPYNNFFSVQPSGEIILINLNQVINQGESINLEYDSNYGWMPNGLPNWAKIFHPTADIVDILISSYP